MIKPHLNASPHGYIQHLKSELRVGKITKELAKELINKRQDKDVIIGILRNNKNVPNNSNNT